MKKPFIAALVVAGILGVSGCSSVPPASPASATHSAAEAKLSGTIIVFGAASLTATFTTLAAEFERANPGVTVQTTFNGSSVLVAQIQGGAPADVFASADSANMARLSTAGLTASVPAPFATNVLEIAVPVGNPAKIKTIADLAKPGVKTVVCAPAVPCGAATAVIEKATGVTISPVSQELAVTGVLSKVETGEADAGLVYVTDIKGAAGKVDGIMFAASAMAVNTYPIAALKSSQNPRTAAAFIAFVASPAGQRVLHSAGFGQP